MKIIKLTDQEYELLARLIREINIPAAAAKLVSALQSKMPWNPEQPKKEA